MSLNGDSSRSSEPSQHAERQPAHPEQFSAAPLSISEALSWDFVRQDGWRPNFLLTPSGRKVSLMSVVAVLIAQPDERTLLIDDGSGVMSARLVGGGPSQHLSVGDVLSVRARLGQANGERFLLAETARALRSHAWLAVRKAELRLRGEVGDERGAAEAPAPLPSFTSALSPSSSSSLSSHASSHTGSSAEEELPEKEEEEKGEGRLSPGSPEERLYALIKKLDEGAGVEMTSLLERALSDGIADAESLIQSLLERGEIFVPRPGILKALE